MNRADQSEVLSASAAPSVVPTCTLMAGLYFLLSIARAQLLEGASAFILSSVAMASALIMLSLVFCWRLLGTRNHAQLFLALAGILVLINTTTQLLVTPDIKKTTNVLVMIMGCSMVLNARASFYPLIVSAVVVWWLTLSPLGIIEDGEWRWFMLFTTLLSVAQFEEKRRRLLIQGLGQLTLAKHNKIISSLLQSEDMTNHDEAGLFKRCAGVLLEELDADRCSIWRFSPEKRQLVCEHSFGPAEIPLLTGTRINYESAPDYFQSIYAEGVVNIPDVKQDYRMWELSEASRADTLSMLDASIMVSGRSMGIVCCETIGRKKVWSEEDISLITALANIFALLAIAEDHRSLERKVLRSEKFESLGLLAGGIAHDFNNLLAVILGYTELIESEFPTVTGNNADPTKASATNVSAFQTDVKATAVPGTDPASSGSIDLDAVNSYLISIRGATERARDLSNLMLNYSGRASLSTRVNNLASLLEDFQQEVLAKPEGHAKLRFGRRDQSIAVRVDPDKFHQVLSQLIINAQDAQAANITISMGSIERPALSGMELATSDPLSAGKYAWISVSDDGKGINKITRPYIFDPFYSTKGQSKGMGLSNVLGIIRAHAGTIQVKSEEGQGAEFIVYLPVESSFDEQYTSLKAEDYNTKALFKNVMLIEDEQGIRDITTLQLQGQGASVISYATYAEYKARVKEQDLTQVDAAIVDLSLPDGDGIQIINHLRQLSHDLPILLISGYDSQSARAQLNKDNHVDFLRKPFDHHSLARSLNHLVSVRH